MQTLTPEQGKFLLDLYLPALQQEHTTTKKVIEAIPESQHHYKPDPASRTSLELASHIAVAEERFMSAIVSGVFDFKNTLPHDVGTPAAIAAWYAGRFADLLAQLQGLEPEKLVRVLDFRGMFQLPAVQYLPFLMHHSIHHRGQLSVHLRAAGGKVPSIYGESYDDAEARKAAAAGR